MKELEQIDKINWCIKLAKLRIKMQELYKTTDCSIYIGGHDHRIEILTASIARLQERRSKITIKLYKLYVTNTN